MSRKTAVFGSEKFLITGPILSFAGNNCIGTECIGGTSDGTVNEPSLWGFVVDRYRAATAWHFEGRDDRNADLPLHVNEAETVGGTKLPPQQSVLHDDGIGRPESKYIFNDGREAVYNGNTGDLITDPEYDGTYNYINPEVGAPWYYPGNLGHGAVDVVPYCVGGNNREGAGPACF